MSKIDYTYIDHLYIQIIESCTTDEIDRLIAFLNVYLREQTLNTHLNA